MAYEIRNDYYEAAKRHLLVCNQLKNYIEQKYREEQEVDIIEKKSLLNDLYYLTGYIIECCCCAAIFHFFPNLIEKKALKEGTDSSYPKVLFKNRASNHLLFGIASSDHTLIHFKETPHFFSGVGNRIPLLNGKDIIFQQNNCMELYKKFCAEIRYNYVNNQKIDLQYQNVFGFFKVAVEIFEKTKTHFKLK